MTKPGRWPSRRATTRRWNETVQATLSRYWRTLRREAGQTMAEYAVILAVITLVVIVAITALSGGIGGALDKVTDLLGGAGESTP